MKKVFDFFGIKKKKKQGFTLVEVIVSLFILTVGVGGAFAAIRSVAMGTNINNSRLTASFLGQEGVEIIRNIRDTNWLQSREDSNVEWDDGIEEGNWEVDYNTETLNNAYNGNGRQLKEDNNGFLSYTGGKNTQFRRKVNIEKLNSNEIKVSVEVKWKERGRSHSVEVVEIIQNWLE